MRERYCSDGIYLRMDGSTRMIGVTARAGYGGVIIALAVTLGWVLAAVPNIELVTLTLSFGGYLLGFGWGAIIGAMGFGLYSALSPFGIAPPPVFIAQLIGGAIIGIGGASIRGIYLSRSGTCRIAIVAAIIGLTVTSVFDILTNLGAFVAMSSRVTLIPFLIGGLGFSVIHIVSNTAIFAIIFPVTVSVLARIGPAGKAQRTSRS